MNARYVKFIAPKVQSIVNEYKQNGVVREASLKSLVTTYEKYTGKSASASAIIKEFHKNYNGNLVSKEDLNTLITHLSMKEAFKRTHGGTETYIPHGGPSVGGSGNVTRTSDLSFNPEQENNFIREMLPLYKKAVAVNGSSTVDISHIDEELKGNIVSTYEKYFHETVPAHEALKRFASIYEKKTGKLPKLTKFLTKEKIKDIAKRSTISGKNIASSLSATTDDEHTESVEKGKTEALLSSIFNEATKAGGIAVSNAIVGKVMERNIRKYLAEASKSVNQYLENVTQFDEYKKFGKPYLIKDNISKQIVNDYQRFFGHLSENDPKKIASQYLQWLQKYNAKEYVRLRLHLEELKENLHATLLNEVTTPVVSGVVAVSDKDKEVAKGVAKHIVGSDKVGSNLKTAIVRPDLGLKEASKGVKAFKATGVTAKHIGSGLLVTSNLVAPDKESAEIINKTTNTIYKTTAFVRFIRNWKQNLLRIRTIGQVAKYTTAFLFRLIGKIFAATVAIFGYVVPIVLIVIVVIASIYPMFLYSGLTHLSQDVAINELYTYISQFPAKADAKYHKQLYSISDPSGNVHGDSTCSNYNTNFSKFIKVQYDSGYIYAPSNDPKREYQFFTSAIDPMAYVSLLSSMYTKFDFPEFKYKYVNDQGNEQSITVDVRNLNASMLRLPNSNTEYNILHHMYVLYYDEKYHDVDGNDITTEFKKNPDNYLYEIDFDRKSAVLWKFMYDGWWEPARKLQIKHDQLEEALTEASLQIQLGYLSINDPTYKKELALYNAMKDGDAQHDEGYSKYFGDNATSNFDKLINSKENVVKNLKKQLQYYKDTNFFGNLLKGAPPCACTLYKNSDAGGAGFYCHSVKNAKGDTVWLCSYDEGTCNIGSYNAEVQSEIQAINKQLDVSIKYCNKVIDDFEKLKNHFGKTEQLINGVITWVNLGGGWYNNGEVANESAIVKDQVAQFEKLYNALSKLQLLLWNDGYHWGSLTSKLTLNEPCCGGCYFNNACDAVYPDTIRDEAEACLSTIEKTLQKVAGNPNSNSPTGIMSIINELKKVTVIDCTTYLNNVLIHATDPDLYTKAKQLLNSSEKIYINTTLNTDKDNELYAWILAHILNVSNAKKYDYIRNARESFIEVYNPYGTVFKSELNMHFLDNISDITEYHTLGYYYDAFAGTVNPTNTPMDYNGGIAGNKATMKDFFTTESYVSNIAGVHINKKGFLDDPNNWANKRPIYRGDLVTTNGNIAHIIQPGGGRGNNYYQIEVDAPISGTIHILSDNGYPYVVITETYTDETGERHLTNAVVIRGVEITGPITDGQEIDVGTEIGKAPVFEIDYIKQADLYYEYLGGHIRIPRDISFYNVSHIYFDWNSPLMKELSTGGG